MRILALETSGEHCSVALWHDGQCVEACADAGRSHSSLLLPMVGRLLSDAATEIARVDAIAFGAGPGSFTGLRIACSVAQGLAFARDLPLVPVGTLEALAEDSGAARVLACIDARMGELYLGAYERRADGWHAACAPLLARPEDLPALAGPWAGCGSGYRAQPGALARAYRLDSVDAGAFPRARAVAALAVRELAAGGGIAAEAAAPCYLRDKVALDVREQAAARAARGTAARTGQ